MKNSKNDSSLDVALKRAGAPPRAATRPQAKTSSAKRGNNKSHGKTSRMKGTVGAGSCLLWTILITLAFFVIYLLIGIIFN